MPGGALVGRTHGHRLVRTDQRVTDQVRRTGAISLVVPQPTPFGSLGNLDTNPSYPFLFPHGYTLDGAEAFLTAALTGDTILSFFLNGSGSASFTLTIPSGSQGPVSTFGHQLGQYHDTLVIKATTLGTGSAVLGGHFRWLAMP